MESEKIMTEKEFDDALAQFKDHVMHPNKVSALPVEAMPPWLSTIFAAMGPILAQLAPVIMQMIMKWIGGLIPPGPTPTPTPTGPDPDPVP